MSNINDNAVKDRETARERYAKRLDNMNRAGGEKLSEAVNPLRRADPGKKRRNKTAKDSRRRNRG